MASSANSIDIATSSSLGWLAVSACAFVISAICTNLGIAYAHRRGLLDAPGQRRSHQIPTPRGGGIGIVAGMLVVVAFAAAVVTGAIRPLALGVGAAVVLVAAVGWIDDHGGLSARTRFAAHCIAAVIVFTAIAAVLGLLGDESRGAQRLLFSLATLVPAIAIVWSINLHNFMDGIDGLLGWQAVFVLAALGLLCARAGHPGQAGCILALAASVAGFLPFNFPHARIFMGDVGSGVVGLMIAIVVLWQMTTPGIAVASGVALCSAFVTDATCTLLSRMWQRRHWYNAHREHLYQWLVRRGYSHPKVVAMYMGWNLLIVLPVVAWMNRMAPATVSTANTTAQGLAAAGSVYAIGFVVWFTAKRACLRGLRREGRRAST
ncbi:MAG: glycosyltransferase family 4 protein [Dokdonella sp.]|uniref:MraY family glycosyltransferase n=1 Tax=Dokdonella sp. TaxID=2291710 RepID=UPI003264E55C